MENLSALHYDVVSPVTRAKMKSQQPLVIWLTGSEASGKSTIGAYVEKVLAWQGHHTYFLDTDNLALRTGGSKDQVCRRSTTAYAGEVCRLMTEAGLVVVAAIDAPFTKERGAVRNMFPNGRFIEVFLDVNQANCRQRIAYSDGRVIRSLDQVIEVFEKPNESELHLNGNKLTIEQSVNEILSYVDSRALLHREHVLSA